MRGDFAMPSKRDHIWNALGGVAFASISFITMIFVSYGQGLDAAGVYSIAFTTSQMLYFVGLFGVNVYQMTDYENAFSNGDYRRAKAMTSGLMLLLSIACIPLLDLTGEKAIQTELLVVFMALTSIGDYQISYYYQHDRISDAGKSLFFRSVLALAMFGLLFVVFQSVVLAIAGMIAAALLGLVVWRVRDDSAGSAVGLARPLELLKICAPLFFASFLISVNINVPKYVINFVSDDSVQGYFGMLLMPAMLISLFSQIVFKPALHDYSNRLSEGKTRFYALATRHMFIIFSLTALCAVASFFIGSWVMSSIFNVSFEGKEDELVLMIVGGGMIAACQLLYYLHVVIRARNEAFCLNLVSCAAAVIIGVALIPMYGLMGAVISLVASQSLLFAGYCVSVFWRLRLG